MMALVVINFTKVKKSCNIKAAAIAEVKPAEMYHIRMSARLVMNG